MAAGLGSRYGWLKQIDPIGPDGEILLEFALKDAIALSIEDVVIIISECIKADFESMIIPKYPELTITLVLQTLDKIPQHWTLNIEHRTLARTKPWGTAHAVWCARNTIKWSFIVMNADDFYGRDALSQAHNFLLTNKEITSHCIITYPITSTLSDHGTVSRGICEVHDGKLVKIVEHTKVAWKDNEWNSWNVWNPSRRLVHTAEDGHEIIVPENAPANMNLFGFQHSFFEILERECKDFFNQFGQDPKREFFLPSVVMQMIKEWTGEVKALSTTSQWFGMTYPEDREEAKKKIQSLIK